MTEKNVLPFGFNAKPLEQFEAETVPMLGPSVVKSRFRGRFVHEFMGMRPKRDWLLKGVFLARTFNLVYGAGGCIAGDTIMQVDVHDGAGRRQTQKPITLERLFHKFHRLPKPRDGRNKGAHLWTILPPDTTLWLPSISDDGRIFRNQIVDVIDSGEKECLLVTLVDGRQIKATPDHRFMTADGYVRLCDLSPGLSIRAHSHRMEKRPKGGERAPQRKFLYLHHHPHARTKVVGGRYVYKAIPRSRAVVEAHMNGMTLENYVALLDESGANCLGLRLLEPGQEVHHKNEDFTDDRIENLEVLTTAEHARLHAVDMPRFLTEPVEIASIAPAGKMRTYDITMAAPFSNFLANDFAVHNCGKSFLMLDLAMTMALAVVDDRAPKEWFGRRIKPCGVIYMAGEGQDDFIIRMHAWLDAKGLKASQRLPVFLIPSAIDLRTGDESAKALIEEIKSADAVMRAEFDCGAEMMVFDTLNKNLAGGDDSKPEHAGLVMKNYQFIREQTDGTIVALHHTSKVGSDPRGHSSIRFDNDGDIYVVGPREGAPNSWTVTRNKAGPAGDRFEFRLRPIEVDRDEHGDPVTSCIVAPGAYVASSEMLQMRDHAEAARTGKSNMTQDGRAILMTNTLKVMRVLHEVAKAEGAKGFNEDGLPAREMPPPDVRVPHGTVAVKQEQWFEEIVRAMPGFVTPTEENKVEFDRHRDKCRKARDSASLKLAERGLIGMDSGWVWRTRKRVAGIDRPEHDEFAPRAEPTVGQMGVTDEEIDGMLK